MAWGFAIVAAVAAAPLPLRAQGAPPETNQSGTVGPRELENFTINGTVTQPAPERPAPAPAPAPATSRNEPASRPAAEQSPPASGANQGTAERPSEPSASRESPAPATSQPLRQTEPSSSVTVALPELDSQGQASGAPVPNSLAEPSTGGFGLWPWLLAALAVAGGLAFYFARGRLQPAHAGGADMREFEAPVPAPAPRGAVAPRHDPVPAPSPPAPASDDPFKGLVSTRLRPWIELGFQPSRCSVEDDKVTIDFEIEMVNSGNAPARAVLIEARLVNAGPEQDSEIGQFFSNPVGKGERIDTIAPLKNVRIKSRIVTPRENVQVYDVGGRKVFVPLIAFNILYDWSRGKGQTSASYLVGRDTKTEKMAPFRIDLGPRLFRSLGQAPLPIAVRQ